MNTIVLSQNAAHEAIEHAKSAPAEMLCIGIDIAKQTHVARAVLGTNKRLKKDVLLIPQLMDLKNS